MAMVIVLRKIREHWLRMDFPYCCEISLTRDTMLVGWCKRQSPTNVLSLPSDERWPENFSLVVFSPLAGCVVNPRMVRKGGVSLWVSVSDTAGATPSAAHQTDGKSYVCTTFPPVLLCEQEKSTDFCFASSCLVCMQWKIVENKTFLTSFC